MSSQCIYCQRSLQPGEQRCMHCGRVQPSSRGQWQPPDDGQYNGWETQEPRQSRSGDPYRQGSGSRSGSTGQPPYRGSRPSSQAFPPGKPPRSDTTTLILKILVVVLIVVLVGIGGAIAVVLAKGGSPNGQAATHVATQTATAGPTTTAAGTATLPAGSLCTASNPGPALTFKGPPTIAFVYDTLLPDTLPQTPLTKDQAQPGQNVTTGNSILLGVQVNLPPAGQAITVCEMTLRLVSFTPLPGPVLNVEDTCSGVYLNPGGPQGAGCGGGFPSDGTADFTFSSTQEGTTVVVPIVGDNNKPAQVTADSQGVGNISANVKLTTPGTYAFSVGLWQDTSGPQYDDQTVDEMILLNDITHYWGSVPCTTPQMQALLPPPTNPPGEFICPGGPPQS